MRWLLGHKRYGEMQFWAYLVPTGCLRRSAAGAVTRGGAASGQTQAHLTDSSVCGLQGAGRSIKYPEPYAGLQERSYSAPQAALAAETA